MSYELKEHFSDNGRYWNAPDQEMNGIILHSIGEPFPHALTYSKIFDQNDTMASIHGCVEPGRFIETAPCFEKHGVAKRCYHIGMGPKGSYNYSRFGIEMTEPFSIHYLDKQKNFEDFDIEETTKFIREVTDTAAEVCADLCIFHNIPINNIQTHKGAYKEGMASEGYDPENLWDYIGYTLEDFKNDVRKYMYKKKCAMLQ